MTALNTRARFNSLAKTAALILGVGLMSAANASPNTAVTAELTKYKTEGQITICEYRTVRQVHYQVLNGNESCPTAMLVAPQLERGTDEQAADDASTASRLDYENEAE
ncbi:hypothetical protein FLM48_19765 [Shewanella sp. Scap07]|uniref:hypothetical protein n=1 Tax=Shewanella sp. Scap07 TaxID=2589987 RepID=UPI0015B8B169|nr:hypothetical protein [Shewanella sp. Scap07]QLE87114.1 hypothetical protein FLM48_19765 [Shewanella sp. Scap07]